MCLKQDGVGRDGQVVDGEGWYIGIYPREHGSNRVEILMFSDGLLVLGSAAVALHSADQRVHDGQRHGDNVYRQVDAQTRTTRSRPSKHVLISYCCLFSLWWRVSPPPLKRREDITHRIEIKSWLLYPVLLTSWGRTCRGWSG